MAGKNWAKSIEVVSNIAVLVVAVALLGALVSVRWWPRPANPKFESGLKKGQVLPPLPSIDYGAMGQTLVTVLSTNCNYCSQSLPFYKRLLQLQQSPKQTTRILAVFPNSQTEVDDYKRQNGLNLESLSSLNYGRLGVTGTPTLILVDTRGYVVDFWVGKLTEIEEQQVLDAVKPR